jgi:5-methylcytosine-specific restriction protein A
MPYKPARSCRVRNCPNLTLSETGYCVAHIHLWQERKPDLRRSASARGYGSEWRVIRQEVLDAAGIPHSEQWRYDVDHFPRYNAEREPDHRKYRLTPRLHENHSRKTASEDGGYGNRGRGV